MPLTITNEGCSNRQVPFRERDQPRPSSALGPAGVMYTLSSLRTSLLLFCTLSSAPVWALHESEAGVVDWQKTFVGVPRTDVPQVAPSFLRVKAKDDETTSLIISATETALGAVNPVDGNIGEYRSSDDPSLLGVFIWPTDPEFLATDSMEVHFWTLGPHTRILQERERWVWKVHSLVPLLI